MFVSFTALFHYQEFIYTRDSKFVLQGQMAEHLTCQHSISHWYKCTVYPCSDFGFFYPVVFSDDMARGVQALINVH